METTTLKAPAVGQGSSYGLASGTGEWERLDAMHQGIRDYLVGKLTLAPLEKPRRILELGYVSSSISGAREIDYCSTRHSVQVPEHAAQEYPDAEVVATDMFPLPPRPLPPNVKFQKVDITGSLPFAPGSFDVVHIRFVLCHLPHGTAVIPRLADLVAPGGYLLLDDLNFPREAMRTSIVRAYTGEMTPAAVAFGITKDVQKALQDEADNRSWEIEMEIVLMWSRKL
ncbi:hypothetical protein EWM64_g6721 [Hericium alpestre]|uniref:Methyltransferase type 11 domain-containing protein n=1 Tax=Hericium alpestre TaxID=135208 RepID=A0A4Y9ZUU0_9AGAM|nr:hypothetical protein EWM64_g6721 [Hericium alpestre]